jgi:hypothetical protein
MFAGNAEIVKLLLDQGADPGQSIYTYDSWDKLLLGARERGYRAIERLLQRALRRLRRRSCSQRHLALAPNDFLAPDG